MPIPGRRRSNRTGRAIQTQKTPGPCEPGVTEGSEPTECSNTNHQRRHCAPVCGGCQPVLSQTTRWIRTRRRSNRPGLADGDVRDRARSRNGHRRRSRHDGTGFGWRFQHGRRSLLSGNAVGRHLPHRDAATLALLGRQCLRLAVRLRREGDGVGIPGVNVSLRTWDVAVYFLHSLHYFDFLVLCHMVFLSTGGGLATSHSLDRSRGRGRGSNHRL